MAAAQDAAQLTPRSLQAALAAKPEGADAEKLAERIRAYFGGSDALLKGAAREDRRADRRVGARGSASRAERRAAGGGRRRQLDRAARRGSARARLRRGRARLSHGTAFTWHYEAGADRRLRRRPARSLRDASRQPRAAGRAEGHGQADAAVGEQDLRGHEARLVGLRAGAVQAGEPGRGHGLPGRRRPQGLRADGLRQPDRQGRHAGHGRHLHQPGHARRRAARTAASSTTRSPISTRGSCSRRSCPRSRRR